MAIADNGGTDLRGSHLLLLSDLERGYYTEGEGTVAKIARRGRREGQGGV